MPTTHPSQIFTGKIVEPEPIETSLPILVGSQSLSSLTAFIFEQIVNGVTP